LEISTQTYGYKQAADGETVSFCSNAPASPFHPIFKRAAAFKHVRFCFFDRLGGGFKVSHEFGEIDGFIFKATAQAF
jgi:hypothetical protein